MIVNFMNVFDFMNIFFVGTLSEELTKRDFYGRSVSPRVQLTVRNDRSTDGVVFVGAQARGRGT